MITDKEIITYLKKNKLMAKAYVINWCLNNMYVKGSEVDLVDGTFLGYVKHNHEYFLGTEPIKFFIDANFKSSKMLYDELKNNKICARKEIETAKK